MNLYNERIFAFYWFWLLFLVGATSYGILVWLAQMSYRSRRSFLKKHLRLNLHLELNRNNQKSFNSFAEEYLGGDGILFLRLIAKNTNSVVAGTRTTDSLELMDRCFLGELLGVMWQQYIEREKTKTPIFHTSNGLESKECRLSMKTD